MEYYFILTNGKKYTFERYFYAKEFYENNSSDVIETNFNYGVVD